MPPTWRRIWFRFFPELPVDKDDLLHGEKMAEGKRALEEGRRQQVEVSQLGDQIARDAEKLHAKRQRNHFSESVTEMLQHGYRS